MLHIVTWFWGTKYTPEDVAKLAAGAHRNLNERHVFTVCHPEPNDIHLTKIPGCFCRLRMFDPAWQEAHGMDDRIVCLDLDTVITGSLDGLFDREDTFSILQDVNTSNPCKFNGSIMMLRAGHHADVWRDFSLDIIYKIPAFQFPDDQGWMEVKIPRAGAFTHNDGCYAFQKKNWPRGNDLPENARIVAFPGWREPKKFQHLDWVREHWTAQ